MKKKLIVLFATVISMSVSYACVYHYWQGCGSKSLSGADICGLTFSCIGTSSEQYDYVKSCDSGVNAYVLEPDFTCHYTCSGQNPNCAGEPDVTLNGTATKTQANMDYTSGYCSDPYKPKCR